jgi:hypothetical protein
MVLTRTVGRCEPPGAAGGRFLAKDGAIDLTQED